MCVCVYARCVFRYCYDPFRHVQRGRFESGAAPLQAADFMQINSRQGSKFNEVPAANPTANDSRVLIAMLSTMMYEPVTKSKSRGACLYSRNAPVMYVAIKRLHV